MKYEVWEKETRRRFAEVSQFFDSKETMVIMDFIASVTDDESQA